MAILNNRDHKYEMDEGLVSTNELLRWQAIMLRRMQVADEASAAYERRKPEIEKHHRERIEKMNGSVTDFALRKAMEESWVLNDLLKKHAWNRDEANRYNNAIMAQWALRRMLTEENEVVSVNPELARILSEAARDAQG